MGGPQASTPMAAPSILKSTKRCARRILSCLKVAATSAVGAIAFVGTSSCGRMDLGTPAVLRCGSAMLLLIVRSVVKYREA